jgi:hypothetical protein
MHKYVNDVIKRESNIKAWKRKWKLELIETDNKEWKDLFYDLTTDEEIRDMTAFLIERERGLDSSFRWNDK